MEEIIIRRESEYCTRVKLGKEFFVPMPSTRAPKRYLARVLQQIAEKKAGENWKELKLIPTNKYVALLIHTAVNTNLSSREGRGVLFFVARLLKMLESDFEVIRLS